MSNRIGAKLAAKADGDAVPATAGQKWKLRQLGVEVKADLTKGEARRLIGGAMRKDRKA